MAHARALGLEESVGHSPAVQDMAAPPASNLPVEICADDLLLSCPIHPTGEALRFYGISFRYAPTPQAKGKIERDHQTWQNRLPVLFAGENATGLAHANELIDELLVHRNPYEKHRAN